MEEGSDRDLAASATPREDSADATLARFLGGSLQAATVRMVIYLAILCAIAATVATLV
jgi:hypothetical protein